MTGPVRPWDEAGGAWAPDSRDVSSGSVPAEETTRCLLARAQAGDEAAREMLVRGHLGLAKSIAVRFRGRGEDDDDLYQVAAIGLLKAIERFDLSRPVRFSTYAVPLIIGELKMHFRNQGTLKVSRSLKSRASTVLACEEQLAQRLGRRPNVGEIAKELGLPADEIVSALECVREPVSVNALQEQDEGGALLAAAEVDAAQAEILAARLDCLALKQALLGLGERERRLLTLRFFAGKTQKEVATLFGVSQVQISRLERTALGSLRALLD